VELTDLQYSPDPHWFQGVRFAMVKVWEERGRKGRRAVREERGRGG